MLDEDDLDSYMTIEHTFMGIRLLNNTLTPAKWKIVVSICGLDVDTIDDEDYDKEVIAAHRKIETWLEYFFTDVIFIDGTDDCSLEIFDDWSLDNTLVYTPGTPTNDVILQTLHSKFFALAGDFLYIGKSTIKSTDSKSTFVFNNPDQECILDDVFYIGEFPVHEFPWWERYDIDTHDLNLEDTDEIHRKKYRGELNTQRILDSMVDDIRKGLGLKIIKHEQVTADVLPISKAVKWKPNPAISTNTDA